MFIQNISELNAVVEEINKLSVQLAQAFEKLKNFDAKIDQSFLQEKERLSTSH